MTESPRTAAGPLWPFLLLNAAAAGWVAFAGIHRGHNSDSLVSTLISLHDWQPFFWQQDRVGMLVPLLASVFRDPVTNLVVQTGLMTFAGLCVPLLLAELIHPHPVGRVAATLANAAMLVWAPDRLRDNFLYECFYPLAMALGCAALLVLGRGPGWPQWWRVTTAAGLLVLACWVYIGVPLWLGPLALVRGWLRPGEPWPAGWRRLLRPAFHPPTVVGCVLMVAAFGVGYELMLAARRANPNSIEPTPQKGLPPSEWVGSWRAFAEHFDRLPGMIAWEDALFGAAAVGVIGTLAVAALTRRRPAYPILAAAGVLLVPAAAEFLFIGTRAWTAANDHHPRYLLGTLESAQTLLALVAVLPLAGWAAGRGRWPLGVAAGVALFAAATVRFGFPAPDRPPRDVDALTGRWTPDVIAANVDAVGGDYWTVWPVVFHVNMTRREHGDHRMFCGVVLRGRVLVRRWAALHPGDLRVAVWRDEKERAAFLFMAPACGLAPPVKVGESGPFDIYVTRATDTAP